MKTLLVLGGSSDLALDYISKYHDRYDSIIAQYYSHSEQLAQLNTEIGDKITAIQADLSVAADVASLIEYLKENNISPSYVLHCPAAKTKMGKISELDTDDLRREMEIEVYSVLSVLTSITDAMQENTFGRICFVLSSVTQNAVSFQTTYMVAKYALLGAMKSLAVELAGKNITVNAVSPTMIETKFIDDVSPFVKKKMLSMAPLNRLATPADVTRAIALLLADDNDYTTGVNLLISGGRIVN